MLAKFLHGTEIPQGGIYPGFGERWEREKDAQIALLIPAVSLSRLCEKVIRGIYFIADEKFIEPPYRVDFYALPEDGAKELNDILEKFGNEFERGPGILVKRAVTAEDGISGLASIHIWGLLKMYASVTSSK